MNFSRPQAGAIFALAFRPTYRKKRDSRGRGKLGRSAAEPFSPLLGDVGNGS